MSLLVTILNFFACLVLVIWGWDDVQSAQAQPTAFLNPLYFGRVPVTAVFDHQFPISQGDDLCGDNGNNVRHFDGELHTNPPFGLGYDGHAGIDYGLNYRPVLAAASGTVQYAGWQEPANHEVGFGLFVRINHPNNNNYRTIYAHMSVVHVQTGFAVYPVVMGVSGNTGNSDGPHLHFEVRNNQNRPVNPYGWDGTNVDPWSIWDQNDHPNCPSLHPAGATSVNLWRVRLGTGERSYPALQILNTLPLQYPSGTQNNWNLENLVTVRIIDDVLPYFIGPGGWQQKYPAINGYADHYSYAGVITSGSDSPATWHITDLPASRYYYVFAYIPQPHPIDPPPSINTAHHATYTIHHAGQIDQAIIAQSQYPNAQVTGWVYLGNYYFNFYGTQSIHISRLSEEHSLGRHILADAIRLAIDSNPVGCPLYTGEAVPLSYDWQVTGDGDSRIKITWSGFDDDAFDYLSIFRSVTPDPNDWTLVHTHEEATSGEWIDTTVTNGVLYYYWLVIVDCYGEVTLSGPQSATTGYSPSPTPDPCACKADPFTQCLDVACLPDH